MERPNHLGYATAPLHRNRPPTGLSKDLVQTPLHCSDQGTHTPQQASQSSLRKDMVRVPIPKDWCPNLCLSTHRLVNSRE